MPFPIVQAFPSASAFVEEVDVVHSAWRPLSDIVSNVVRHVEVQSAVSAGVSGRAELSKAA
jgi:hypothetical protein